MPKADATVYFRLRRFKLKNRERVRMYCARLTLVEGRTVPMEDAMNELIELGLKHGEAKLRERENARPS